MSTPTDTAHQAAFNKIESDYTHNGNESTGKLHQEVHHLLHLDSGHRTELAGDLHTLTKQLHAAHILPNLDIVETGKGEVAFRGIGHPGKAPSDGKAALITRSDGKTFTYNRQGEVQSWSKGGDTWTYNAKDGKFHETVNGQPTDKTSSDAVSVGANGQITAAHKDGSTTETTRYGDSIDRNARGQMTREASGPDVKTFTWKGSQLESMTDRPHGKHEETYTLASDGKYYSSSDRNHENPISISVEPDKNADGSAKADGVVQLTDSQGKITDSYLGGTNVHWNSNHELTQIDYSNGNKATGFTYAADQLSAGASGAPSNPLGLPTLTGFMITGKDGHAHTYSSDPSQGTISIDGGKAVQGTLSASADGTLTATQTGDGSDSQYRSIKFDLSGVQVQEGKFDGRTEVDRIVGWTGAVSKFGYDSRTGRLDSVDAYGFHLKKSSSGHWLDAAGKRISGNPDLDANGNFSMTDADGSFTTYGGVRPIEGIPDTPDAIAKEAKAEQAAEPDSAGQTTAGSDGKGSSGKVPPPSHFNQELVNAILKYAGSSQFNGEECLEAVTDALSSLGMTETQGVPAAWDALSTLEQHGFKPISQSDAKPGDLIVRSWSQATIAANGGNNFGDIGVITSDNNGTIMEANDLAPYQYIADNPRYGQTIFLQYEGTGTNT